MPDPNPNLDRDQTGEQTARPGADESTGRVTPHGAGLSPPATPARIGRYEVRQVLGEGAFGRVYRGFDPELHRDVAIKVPHPHGLTLAFRERFLREARATATIHHPNVCPVYDIDSDGDVPFIVMHFVPDGTLASILEQRSLAPRDAVDIARKLALGVAAAHAKGVTLLERLPVVFQTDEQHAAEAARAAELERLVGQQALELAALKKASMWQGGATTNGGGS
jgi:serine/threonine-protein kinase